MATPKNCWGGKPQPLTIELITALRVKEQEGSETAHKILKTFEYNTDLLPILETCDYSLAQKLKIVDLLYLCATLEWSHFVCEGVSEKLNLIIAQLYEEKCEEIGELDMKIRFCCCTLNLKRNILTNDLYPVDILKEGVRRYPDNCHYFCLLLTVLAFKNEYEEGLVYAKGALKKFPENVELLYSLAVMLMSIESSSSSEIVEAFQKFLDAAPSDHQKLPEAYYTLSAVYLRNFLEEATEENWELMETTYENGLKAEKDQLPCYLPYGQTQSKSVVGDILHTKREILKPKPSSENIGTCFPEISVLEKKPYLSSQNRMSIIIEHRRLLQKCSVFEKALDSMNINMKLQPPLKSILNLKPITLKDMSSKEDGLLENRIIEFLIIEEPNPYLNSMNLVGEDENGDVSLLFMRNIKKDNESMNKFQAGCRLAIINPFMQWGGKPGIINDSPDCIVHLEKVNNMCRYCGEENATRKCSKCKRPYCSRECQGLDWTELGHKLICSLKVNF